jgi:hypothetical protein
MSDNGNVDTIYLALQHISQIVYANNHSSDAALSTGLQHGGTGGHETVFQLDPGEYITAVLGRHNGWVVQLCFVTSKGEFRCCCMLKLRLILRDARPDQSCVRWGCRWSIQMPSSEVERWKFDGSVIYYREKVSWQKAAPREDKLTETNFSDSRWLIGLLFVWAPF